MPPPGANDSAMIWAERSSSTSTGSSSSTKRTHGTRAMSSLCRTGVDRGPDGRDAGRRAGARLTRLGDSHRLDRATARLDRLTHVIDAVGRAHADEHGHATTSGRQRRADPPRRFERAGPRDERQFVDRLQLLWRPDDEQAVGADRLDDVAAERLDLAHPRRDRRTVELHHLVRPRGPLRTRHTASRRDLGEHVGDLDVDDLVVEADQVRVRQQLHPRARRRQRVEVGTAANDDARVPEVVLHVDPGRGGQQIGRIRRDGSSAAANDRLVRHGTPSVPGDRDAGSGMVARREGRWSRFRVVGAPTPGRSCAVRALTSAGPQTGRPTERPTWAVAGERLHVDDAAFLDRQHDEGQHRVVAQGDDADADADWDVEQARSGRGPK